MWMLGVKSEWTKFPGAKFLDSAALLDFSKALDKVPHGNPRTAQIWCPSARPINQH